MKIFSRVSLYLPVWAALLFAFVWLSAPRFWRDISAGGIPPNEALASVNEPFEKKLGVRGATTLLQNHLAHLPTNARILFLIPKSDDDTWDFFYAVTSYLSWPRTLEKKVLGPNEPVPVDAGNVDVIICCGIQVPPKFASQWSLGPKFVWSERR